MSALPGRAATYRVIHSFSYGDGTYPFAGLLPAGDKLYGTTSAGGKSQTQGGCGTVFVIAALQTESLLHSFQCPPDGEYPTDSLIKVGGDLYGTTQGGGTYRNGTVFALTKSGKEHVIYNFQGGNDGAPAGGRPSHAKWQIYGTTPIGGAYGQGTVFEITEKGKEHRLHSFGYMSDGAGPDAGLIVSERSTLWYDVRRRCR